MLPLHPTAVQVRAAGGGLEDPQASVHVLVRGTFPFPALGRGPHMSKCPLSPEDACDCTTGKEGARRPLRPAMDDRSPDVVIEVARSRLTRAATVAMHE